MKKNSVCAGAVAVVALLVGCLAGCGKPQDNSAPSKDNVSATAGKAVPIQAGKKGDLPQKSCDAVEYAIAIYVQQTGQMSGFMNASPRGLDEAEIQRLSALGKMEFDCKMGGITASLDGSKNIVDPDGYMDVTLNGDTMTCKIRIGEGSFGIENGKVVIGEGTRLTFDGSHYIRKDGLWMKSE